MMQVWIFWAAAAAITCGVAALLVQAMRRGDAATDDAAALKVYRDQLAEVDRDAARAVISQPEADRVRIEVQRRLLDADRAQKAAPVAGSKTSFALAATLTAAVLAMGLYGYAQLGAPGYPDMPLATRLALSDELYRTRPLQAAAEASAPVPQTVQPDADFLALMEKLRAAMASRPNDTIGLALLAKNEAQLGNFVAAAKAYAALVAAKGDTATADDHAGLAQTMIAAAGGYVSPEAEIHLIRALELDPAHGLSRYFSGLMFAQVGRPDRAFALWEPLLREGPPDAPWMEPIRSGLQSVADSAGIKYQLPDLKGPDAGDMAAASDMTPEDRQAMIKGMVEQLETRLTQESGPVEEWARLITSLGVLGELSRATAAYENASAIYQTDPAAIAALQAAAATAGITP